MIRIVLVDDHALVRAGFRSIIERELDMQCVGEAASGEEALPLVRQLRPDVVICDLHLPGISGLEVTERLAHGSVPSRVMIVTVQDEGPLPRRLLNAGALGYVAKACEQSEFVRAIRDIARGRRYLSSEIAQRLALEPDDGGRATPFDVLTPRELEVVRLLCQGKRMTVIGELLNLSPKTVSTHKYRVYDKVGVRDEVSLARLADSYGLFAIG